MLAQRSTHYWLWFILFGVISALVNFFNHTAPTYETWWLLVTGLIGVVLGIGLFSSIARPYDIIIGILFTGVGLLGVLHNFDVNIVTSNPTVAGHVDSTNILGLSFALPYALIHTLLGLTSLNTGMNRRASA